MTSIRRQSVLPGHLREIDSDGIFQSGCKLSDLTGRLALVSVPERGVGVHLPVAPAAPLGGRWRGLRVPEWLHVGSVAAPVCRRCRAGGRGTFRLIDAAAVAEQDASGVAEGSRGGGGGSGDVVAAAQHNTRRLSSQRLILDARQDDRRAVAVESTAEQVERLRGARERVGLLE